MTSNLSDDDHQYWAFISYSHKDSIWASWLHKTLETYKIPKNLVGTETRSGVVPGRIMPVFRDREELPTASDLGENLIDALRQSKYLIVICSPGAAQSRWVNEEIRLFKSLGRANRILAIIVDGEPGGEDSLDRDKGQCFPETLLFDVDADGALTDVPCEPISADARPDGDGKKASLLKLVAGITGLPYAKLSQRDKVRRRQRNLQLAAIGAVALAIAGALSAQWYLERERSRLLALEQEADAAAFDLKRGKIARAVTRWAGLVRDGGATSPYATLLAQWRARLKPYAAVHPELKTGHVYSYNGQYYVKKPDGQMLSTGTDWPVLWAQDDGHLFMLEETGANSLFGRVIDLGKNKVVASGDMPEMSPLMVIKPDLVPGFIFWGRDLNKGRYDRLVHMDKTQVTSLFPDSFYTEVSIGEPCGDFLNGSPGISDVVTRAHFKDGRFVTEPVEASTELPEKPAPGQQFFLSKNGPDDKEWILLHSEHQGEWASHFYLWVTAPLDEQCDWAARQWLDPDYFTPIGKEGVFQSQVLTLPALVPETDFWAIEDLPPERAEAAPESDGEATGTIFADRLWQSLKAGKQQFFSLHRQEQRDLLALWISRSREAFHDREDYEIEFEIDNLVEALLGWDWQVEAVGTDILLTIQVNLAQGAGFADYSLLKFNVNSGRIVAEAGFATDIAFASGSRVLPGQELIYVGSGGHRTESFQLFDAVTLEDVSPMPSPDGDGNFAVRYISDERALFVHTGSRLIHYARAENDHFEKVADFIPNTVPASYEAVIDNKFDAVEGSYDEDMEDAITPQDFAIHGDIVVMSDGGRALIGVDRKSWRTLWEYEWPNADSYFRPVFGQAFGHAHILVCDGKSAMVFDPVLGLPLTGVLPLSLPKGALPECGMKDDGRAMVTTESRRYMHKPLTDGLTPDLTDLTHRTFIDNPVDMRPLDMLPGAVKLQ